VVEVVVPAWPMTQNNINDLCKEWAHQLAPKLLWLSAVAGGKLDNNVGGCNPTTDRRGCKSWC
jgi:hypothetical protein